MDTKNLWTLAEALVLADRYSMDVWGGGGGGKTHFIVFTCPGPVYLINLDMRDPTSLIKKSGRTDVVLCDLRQEAVLITDKQVEEKLTRLNAAIADALKQPKGTLAIDGGSVLSNLLEKKALAELNKSQRGRGKETFEKLPALHRGAINAYINDLLASAGSSALNFVITHQQREIWSDEGKPTGTFEARENTQVEYGVDVSIRMFAEWVSAKKNEPAKIVHRAKIVVCKHNEAVVQQKVTDPSWNYIIEMVKGDLDE